MSGFAVDSISNYANDPYAKYALSSYNPNFRAAQDTTQQAQQAQYAQLLKAAQEEAAKDTTAGGGTTDPTFRGSSYGEAKDSGISGGTVAAVVGTVGAAATLIAAYKKGKGAGAKGALEAIGKGFGEMGKGVKKFLGIKEKVAAEGESLGSRVSNLLKDKGLKEAKVKNGNDLITIRNGRVEEIAAITEKKNTSLAGTHTALTPKSKDVTFAHIERTVKVGGKDYRVVLDKEGNVVETLVKNSKGKFVKPSGELKDAEKIIEQAQTYTAELKNVKLTLPDRHGVPTDITRSYNVSVRNGQVVDATYTVGGTTKHLTEEQLKLLQEVKVSDIEKFGNVKGGLGLKPEECIYEHIGSTRRTLFNGKNKITEAFDRTSKPLKGKKEVADYLEKHNITKITEDGIIPEGMSLANATYKTKSGNIFTIKDGKIENIKIKEGCKIKNKKGKEYTFSAGETIKKGDAKFDVWQNTAANSDDFELVKGLL